MVLCVVLEVLNIDIFGDTKAKIKTEIALVEPYEAVCTRIIHSLTDNYLFQPEVKNDVAAISKINAVWMRMFESSKYSKHIIRR